MNSSLIGLPVILMMALVVWLGFREQKATKAQSALLDELLKANPKVQWIRVFVGRADWPWWRSMFDIRSVKGIVVIDDDDFRVIANLADGKRMDRRFRRGTTQVRWPDRARGEASLGVQALEVGYGADTLLLMGVPTVNGQGLGGIGEATKDLWRHLAPGAAMPPDNALQFAIEKNRGSLAVAIAFFVLLGYGVADRFSTRMELLPGSVIERYEFWSTLTIPLFVFMLRRALVPWAESLILSTLLAAAIGLAWLPAMKRVEAALSPQGVQEHRYVMESEGKFSASSTADEARPPDIDFTRMREYWAQFPKGSEHSFRLVHGPLGSWQLDHSELHEKMKAYYEERRR